MAVTFYIIFLVNLVLLKAFPDTSEIEFVTVVYRHGDRTPVRTFPTDRYDESYWPSGWGQLTNAGKNEHFELGKWLRDRYQGFLPLEYNEKDIYVESTNYSRTLMSALSNLAGLYEPVGRDVWRPNINWQPIPVRISSQFLDYGDVDGLKCEKYEKLEEELQNSESVQNQSRKYSEVFKNLTELSGMEIPELGFSKAGLIYESFFIEQSNGLELPSWAHDYYPQPLTDINNYESTLPANNQDLKRLKCGPFLKEILDHFDQKINGSLTKKMWQYSGHDTTVANLMQCLNVYDNEVPPYASALILELHKQRRQYHVRVSYRKDQVLTDLTIPGCTARCPLDNLKNLMQPVIPGDWKDECQIN